MTHIEQDLLLEKLCCIWNKCWHQIIQYQDDHPQAEEQQDEDLRAMDFEIEILDRKMEKLIPISHMQAIHDLIYV